MGTLTIQRASVSSRSDSGSWILPTAPLSSTSYLTFNTVIAAATACQNISVLAVSSHVCRVPLYSFTGLLPSFMNFYKPPFWTFSFLPSVNVLPIEHSFASGNAPFLPLLIDFIHLHFLFRHSPLSLDSLKHSGFDSFLAFLSS
jgi:hypothetical protein